MASPYKIRTGPFNPVADRKRRERFKNRHPGLFGKGNKDKRREALGSRRPGIDPGFNKPTRPKKPSGNKLPYLDKNFDPLSPVSGKQAKRYVNTAVRLQSRPLERELGAEHRATADRENRIIPAWFQGYQNDLARWRGESQAASNAAIDRVQGFLAQGGQQDAANRAAQEQRLMADAQSRGVAYDPTVLAQVGNAEAARNNVSASTLGTLAGQGANQFAYLTNKQAIGRMHEQEAIGEAGARRRKVEADQRELAAKKGDLAYQTMRDLTDSERKFYLEGKSLQGDKQAEKGRNWRARLAADTSVQNSKRSSKTSRKNAQLSQKQQNQRQEDKQAFDKRENKKDRKAQKKGKKS